MTGKESIHTQGSRRVLWRNGNPNTVTIARRVWATDQFYPSDCRLIHLRVKSLTRWLLLGYELWRASQPRSRSPLLPGPWERGWTNQNCYVINGTVFRVASCADPLWDCVTSMFKRNLRGLYSGDEGGAGEVRKLQTANHTNQEQKLASRRLQRQKSHNQHPASVVATAG